MIVEYTEEEIKNIKKLFKEGKSLHKISKTTGFSKYSLRKIKNSDFSDNALKFYKEEKKIYSEEIIQKVKELESNGDGTRKIAKKLLLTRDDVIKIVKDILKIDISKKKLKRTAYAKTEQKCSGCYNIKIIKEFRAKYNKKQNRHYFSNECFICERLRINKAGKKLFQNNKNNPEFVLKRNISWNITNTLKNNNSSKNKESCMKYVKFTIKQLKEHIESLFEPWMNWENRRSL